MIVVTPLQLVLDDHRVAIFIFSDKIDTEIPSRLLPLCAGYLALQRVVDYIEEFSRARS
jgi:hypothetical protein